MRIRFKSIASRIAWLILPIVAATTLASVLVVSVSASKHITGQFDERVRAALSGAVSQVEKYLIRNTYTAMALAQHMSHYEGTATVDSLRPFLDNVVTYDTNTIGCGIFLSPFVLNTGSEGLGVYSILVNDQLVATLDYSAYDNYHNAAWYRASFRVTDLFWTGVYYDPVMQMPVVSALAPIYDRAGKRIGTADADMTLSYIRQIASNITVGQTGRAFIIGRDGEYISFINASRDINRNIREDEEPGLAALGQAMAAAPEGEMDITLYGEGRRAYYTTIEETGWTLAVLIDADEITASARSMSLHMAVAPLVGLSLVIFVIALLVMHLRRIVRQVNRFAALAANGDFTQQIEVTENDEFGDMQANLNKMMDDMNVMHKNAHHMLELAHEASRAKTDFLSNMSHEIRTPMNAIIGMTAIGLNAGDMERKDYAFGKIGDASTHLLGVINDILDMSKIEANKLELSPVAFDFERALQRVVGVVSFRVDERHQSLGVHLDPRIPQTIVGDDQRLSQVITNLLGNAVKFTPDGGLITLSAKLLAEREGMCEIQVSVVDTGIGISPEQQSKLFQSFQQAESGTSRKFGGTGLGLAISKRIVELMGGKVWVESELGKGSAFIFTFQAERSDAQSRAPRPDIDWKNLNILVVDDVPEVLEHVKEITTGFGVRCDTALSGDEALTLLRRRAYQICFVDWNMPGMDGIDLTRRIKETEAGNVVVIMISSAEWAQIEHAARAAGVEKFIQKPLFPSTIYDCIAECIGGVRAEPEAEAKPDVPRFEGHTILLAEDIDINREIVLTLLEPTALIVDCAENGEEAVRLFQANPNRYDVIFMDVQMPVLDGLSATRQIRALSDPAAQTVPIVAMTANVFREDVDRCLSAGMNDHVGKPLDFDEVLEKLRRYIPRPDDADD